MSKDSEIEKGQGDVSQRKKKKKRIKQKMDLAKKSFEKFDLSVRERIFSMKSKGTVSSKSTRTMLELTGKGERRSEKLD